MVKCRGLPYRSNPGEGQIGKKMKFPGISPKSPQKETTIWYHTNLPSGIDPPTEGMAHYTKFEATALLTKPPRLDIFNDLKFYYIKVFLNENTVSKELGKSQPKFIYLF